MPEIRLRPNGDSGTLGTWTDVPLADAHYLDIDDYVGGGSSDGDSSYVQGPNNGASSMFVLLEDTPADFLPANITSIEVRYNARKNSAGVSNGVDVITLSFQVFRSNETTALTDEKTTGDLGTTYAQGTLTGYAQQGTNTKADWDGARLRIRQAYTAQGMADGTTQGRLTAVEVIINYTSPPKSTGTARISLASLATPASRVLHSIKVRAKKMNAAHSGRLRAWLFEGANDRSGQLESPELSTTDTTYRLSVSDANAAAITSYADLEVRIQGHSAGGDATEFRVAKAFLEIPAQSGGVSTDSGTVYIDLVPSAVETHPVVDVGTVTVKITPEGTDTHQVGGVESTDSATVYIDIIPDGTELLVRPKASEFTDNFESTLDIAKWVASATGGASNPTTVGGKLRIVTPANAIGYGKVTSVQRWDLTDSHFAIELPAAFATVGGREVDLQITGEVGNRFVIAIEEGYWAIYRQVGGGSTELVIYDTYNATTHRWLRFREASGTIYIEASSDGINWSTELHSQATPFNVTNVEYLVQAGNYSTAPDSVNVELDNLNVGQTTDVATVYVDITPSGNELVTAVEAATVYVDIQPSATDTDVVTDAATVTVVITPSADESQQGGYSDSATVYIDIKVSGVTPQFPGDDVFPTEEPFLLDLVQFSDAATVSILITPSATDTTTGATSDSGTVYIGITPTGTEKAHYADSAVVPIQITPSGTDTTTGATSDTGTVYVDITPFSTDRVVWSDTATVNVNVVPSAVEARIITDSATAYIDITPSGVAVSQTTDSALVRVRITPSAIEEYIAQQVVYVKITVTAQESHQSLITSILSVSRVYTRWAGRATKTKGATGFVVYGGNFVGTGRWATRAYPRYKGVESYD